MDKFQVGQDLQKGLAQVEDGDLTPGTGIEPFFCYFNWHESFLLTQHPE
jgi:hypothetical protein